MNTYLIYLIHFFIFIFNKTVRENINFLTYMKLALI